MEVLGIKALYANAIILFVIFLFFLSPTDSQAGKVTLAWDPPDIIADVFGYVIHYGTFPGTYFKSIDLGNTTSCTFSNLIGGQTYYFTVTSYDAAGYQSVYSNEVSIVIKNAGLPWLPLLLGD